MLLARSVAGAVVLLIFGFISGYLLFFALGAILVLVLGLYMSREVT